MNLRTVIITATTAAVLATSGVALAGAANSPASSTSSPAASSTAATGALPNATAPEKAAPSARTRPRLRRLIRRGAARVIAETVGIDRKTLRHDLRAGQTVADIATAHGVDPKSVVTALVTAATTKLDAAAQAGLITPARAHRIEQRLPDRITKFVNTWHPKRARTTTS